MNSNPQRLRRPKGFLTCSSPCGWPAWTCTLPGYLSGNQSPCTCRVHGEQLGSQQKALKEWKQSVRDEHHRIRVIHLIFFTIQQKNSLPVKEVSIVGHKDVWFGFLNVIKESPDESRLQPKYGDHMLSQ